MAGFGGTDRWGSDSFNEMFLDPSTPLSDLLQGSNKTDNRISATDVYTVLPDDTWNPLNISNCDAEDILTFSLNNDYYSEQLITSVSSSSPKPDATIVFSHGPATGSLSSKDMTFMESMVPSGHENWTIPSQENMADVSSQSCKISSDFVLPTSGSEAITQIKELGEILKAYTEELRAIRKEVQDAKERCVKMGQGLQKFSQKFGRAHFSAV